MADELTNVTSEPTKSEPKKAETKPDNATPSVDELVTQLAQEKAQRAKDKIALDKLMKETGELKKALRERQTAEEQIEEAKREAEAEKDARLESLEIFKRTAEAKDRYIAQGMPPELATLASEAEISGDMDALATLQRKHTEELLKAKEAEWMKSRPEINAGIGADGEADPFLQGFNS